MAANNDCFQPQAYRFPALKFYESLVNYGTATGINLAAVTIDTALGGQDVLTLKADESSNSLIVELYVANIKQAGATVILYEPA